MGKFLNSDFFPQFMHPSRLGLDLAVDVYEEDGHAFVTMALPGVKREELDISIEDDVLTVSGKRTEEAEKKNRDYYSKEIRKGSFTRAIALPGRVHATKAVAKLQDGQLKVEAPLISGDKEKRVRVPLNA